MYYSLCSYNIQLHAVPHYSPAAGGNQKSILNTKRSLYFLLPCGGSATCWRYTVAGHRKPRIVLLALTPGSLSCHAKQATHVLRLHIFNTYGAATVNAWRRTVAQK
jgi:hypothetical protein